MWPGTRRLHGSPELSGSILGGLSTFLAKLGMSLDCEPAVMTQENRENSLITNIQLCKIQIDEIDENWKDLKIFILMNDDAGTDRTFSENQNVNLVINTNGDFSDLRLECTFGAGVEVDDLKQSLIRHAQLILNFSGFYRNVEHLLAEAAAESGFQELGNADRRLWKKISIAQDDLTLRLLLITPVFGGKSTIHLLHPISDILKSSVAIMEANPGLHSFGEVELKRARTVLESVYFDPDRWMSNLGHLEVVTGENAGSRLPGSIRLRLKEIYQTYFFGNHLSAIALARATLEYAIKDKGASIGILTKQMDGRDVALAVMIESLSSIRPELRDHLEAIRESGNRTLHPIKKERLFLDEEYLQGVALNCIRGLRDVLEKIYFSNP